MSKQNARAWRSLFLKILIIFRTSEPENLINREMLDIRSRVNQIRNVGSSQRWTGRGVAEMMGLPVATNRKIKMSHDEELNDHMVRALGQQILAIADENKEHLDLLAIAAATVAGSLIRVCAVDAGIKNKLIKKAIKQLLLNSKTREEIELKYPNVTATVLKTN